MKRTHVSVSADVVDGAKAVDFVTDSHCGAVSSFIGVTRRDSLGTREVIALEFEAHTALAESVMKDIIHTYREENAELQHVFVHHRLGLVPVGQGNVVIAVSAGHRAAAFAAVEALMNNLKATLPVWKKELYNDESYRWLENAEFNAA